jgi:hypothetical protein
MTRLFISNHFACGTSGKQAGYRLSSVQTPMEPVGLCIACAYLKTAMRTTEVVRPKSQASCLLLIMLVSYFLRKDRGSLSSSYCRGRCFLATGSGLQRRCTLKASRLKVWKSHQNVSYRSGSKIMPKQATLTAANGSVSLWHPEHVYKARPILRCSTNMVWASSLSTEDDILGQLLYVQEPESRR